MFTRTQEHRKDAAHAHLPIASITVAQLVAILYGPYTQSLPMLILASRCRHQYVLHGRRLHAHGWSGCHVRLCPPHQHAAQMLCVTTGSKLSKQGLACMPVDVEGSPIEMEEIRCSCACCSAAIMLRDMHSEALVAF